MNNNYEIFSRTFGSGMDSFGCIQFADSTLAGLDTVDSLDMTIDMTDKLEKRHLGLAGLWLDRVDTAVPAVLVGMATLDSIGAAVELKHDLRIDRTKVGILAELLVVLNTPVDIVDIGRFVGGRRFHSSMDLKIQTVSQAGAMLSNILDRRIYRQSNSRSFEVLI